MHSLISKSNSYYRRVKNGNSWNDVDLFNHFNSIYSLCEHNLDIFSTLIKDRYFATSSGLGYIHRPLSIHHINTN
jgi:hypothetical protein